MCKGNKSTQTQNTASTASGSGSSAQVNTALPQFGDAYSNLLTQIQGTASTPFTNYSGPLVEGFNPTQEAAFGTIGNVTGASGDAVAQPYLTAANQDFTAATKPLWENTMQFSPDVISQFESPYTRDVVKATEAEFANTNAQQFNQAAGSAAAAGAFGGDRQAVLDAILAEQQQKAEAPVIANLENTGFATALDEFNKQQQAQLGANEANSWLNSQIGFGEQGLGTTAQELALSGANQELGIGGLQQQLGQENLNVPYEQWLAQQAYPFQTENWAAGLESLLGGSAGSVSAGSDTSSSQSQSTGTTTNQSNPGFLSSLFGGLESLAGLGGMTGAFGSSGYLSNLFGPSVSDIASSTNGQLSSTLGTSMLNSFQPVYPTYKKGGGLPSNVIPFRRRGLPKLAAGGDPETVLANDNYDPDPSPQPEWAPPVAATGMGDAMPYPNLDFHPQPLPDNSAADLSNAPWEALLAAGADTLSTGNIGSGIGAGLKSYQAARAGARAEATEAIKEANDQGYRQADIEKGADTLWQSGQEAKARIAQEQNDLDFRQKQAEREQRNADRTANFEAERIGQEGARLDQGRYSAPVPGYGTDPESGETVPGAYTTDLKTGIPHFNPGVTLSARQPAAKAPAMTPNQAMVQARKDWDNWAKQDKANGGEGTVYNSDGSKADAATWLANRAGQYLSKTGSPQQRPNAPSPAAATLPAGGPPPRPPTVPAGSLYSPSRQMWRDASGRMYNKAGQPIQ